MNAAWIAVRDGDGPWLKPEGSAGVYEVPITNPDGRYTVAFLGASVPGSYTQVEVIDGTVTELPALTIFYSENNTPPPTHAVSGSLLGLSSGQGAMAELGPFGNGAIADASGNYAFTTASGTFDLLVGRYPVASGSLMDRMIIRRGVVVADATSALPTLDFSTESFALTPCSSKLQGADPTDQVSLSAGFRTGGTVGSGISFSGVASSTFAFNAVPLANQISTDANVVSAAAGSAPNESRLVGVFFKEPAPQVLNVPTPLMVSDPTFSGAPTNLLPSISWGRATWAQQYQVQFHQGSSSVTRIWALHATAGWLGSTPTLTFGLPDLSGIPGYNPAWSLVQGNYVAWYFDAHATNGALEAIPENIPLTDGTRWTKALRSGGLTP